MNRHVQETEGYVIRRVSGIITGFFVVSLITAPVLWMAGTGGTGSGTSGIGSGTIEQPGGSGASGGTGTGPTIERPASGTGGTESSAGKRGDGTSGSPGSGTGGAGTSR